MHLYSIQSTSLFPEAAEHYLNMRTVHASAGRYIEKTTERNYRQNVKSLGLFLGHLRLDEIHLGHIREYQKVRLAGAEPFVRKRRPHEEPKSCPTKARHVNQELCILRAIMRRGNAWTAELEDNYEELLEHEPEIPRALTEEEQRRWLDISRQKERWSTVHWYSIVAFDTTMSTNEMRSLRIGDVNLHHRTINVPWPGSKNRHRHRSIPVDSADCLWALERLLIRAADLGCQEPQHYLFPYCHGHRLNLDRPMSESGLKKPWNELRLATKLPNFRMYDTRHTAITRMAEAGVPVQVIMAKAGHISPKMTQHYTHISLAIQRKWMAFAQEMKRPPSPQWVPSQRYGGGY